MDEKSWLQVSVLVGGEAAEAAAEVFSRYIESGVVIEKEGVEEVDVGNASLYKVIAYLPNDASIEDRKSKIEKGLWHLGQISPIPAPQYEIVHDQNWMEAWKAHYQPLEVGERIMVLPAWSELKAKPNRAIIRIEPGMGFGTGTHPTTQLSMMLIERHIKHGGSMIDVGTGSGILAVAGAKLGAQGILAVDVDAKAIQAAEECFKLNQVGGKIELGLGSVAEIRAGTFGRKQADLVAANILAKILLGLFEDGLGELAAPGGTLILSGILEEHEGEIRTALDQAGLVVIDRVVEEDWVALAATHAG